MVMLGKKSYYRESRELEFLVQAITDVCTCFKQESHSF